MTARLCVIMDSFAQNKVGASLQSLDLFSVLYFVKGFLSRGRGWQALSDPLFPVGPVRSLALVEREVVENERFYRYRVTYTKDRLLLGCWLNKENRIVRIRFQLE